MRITLFLIILLSLFSCKQKNDIKGADLLTNSYYEKAKKFRDAHIIDSAFYYYNIAKESYLKKNDSSGVAKSLVNMAIIQVNKGDYFGGIESSLEANNFLRNEKDSLTRSILVSNYNNLAISSAYLTEFENAVKFYEKGLQYVDNEEHKNIYYNNIGDVLLSQRKIKPAKVFLKKALQSKDSINYARALNNFAKAKFIENKNYNALPELYKALEIRLKENNTIEANSSYSTLTDYFTLQNNKKALIFAKDMLDVATLNKSPDNQLQALQKIINIDPNNSSNYFNKYLKLNDSLQTARSKAKNQFAIIRYDVEKIKSKNAENEIKILEQYFLLSFLGLSIIILIIWYIKRQKQLKQEKELEVKNTQLKMSKRVHDVVANGIYQVMAKIENQEDFDRNKALDELEYVYEKSRDLSYEKAGEEKEFSQEISELIAGFNNATVKTFTAGNDPSVWEKVSTTVKEEVYQMIRELMVNMKKHSQASHVAVKFEKTDGTVEIQYKDNGVGISGDLIYKNGLRNTASRIEAIGGTITFDTKIEKGLKVNLSFPSS